MTLHSFVVLSATPLRLASTGCSSRRRPTSLVAPRCGVLATGHGRSVVQVRDLPISGKPVRPDVAKTPLALFGGRLPDEEIHHAPDDDRGDAQRRGPLPDGGPRGRAPVPLRHPSPLDPRMGAAPGAPGRQVIAVRRVIPMARSGDLMAKGVLRQLCTAVSITEAHEPHHRDAPSCRAHVYTVARTIGSGPCSTRACDGRSVPSARIRTRHPRLVGVAPDSGRTRGSGIEQPKPRLLTSR